MTDLPYRRALLLLREINYNLFFEREREREREKERKRERKKDRKKDREKDREKARVSRLETKIALTHFKPLYDVTHRSAEGNRASPS